MCGPFRTSCLSSTVVSPPDPGEPTRGRRIRDPVAGVAIGAPGEPTRGRGAPGRVTYRGNQLAPGGTNSHGSGRRWSLRGCVAGCRGLIHRFSPSVPTMTGGTNSRHRGNQLAPGGNRLARFRGTPLARTGGIVSRTKSCFPWKTGFFLSRSLRCRGVIQNIMWAGRAKRHARPTTASYLPRFTPRRASPTAFPAGML